MIFGKQRLYLLTTAAMVCTPQVALAQAAPEAQDEVVEAAGEEQAYTGQVIVVTANKREESLMEVPMSITALSGEELTDKGIDGVEDLVKVTPGLSYVESGRSVPVFSLRGVGFFDVSLAAKPTVSVYVDEAPIPFSIEAKGAGFDLERVEVLKGPQGTLFGQNATGGAINYVAAKPTDTFDAGATLSYARFNTIDAQGFVSGPLSDTLNARLAVRGVTSDGWQVSQSRGDELGEKNFVQGRFLVDWLPTDRFKLSLSASGWHDGSETQAPQYLAFLPSNPARAPFIPLLEDYPTTEFNARAADWDQGRDYEADNTFYRFTARADYEALDALTLTSITSYSHLDVDQLAEGDGTPLTNFNAQQLADVGSFSQELRASGDIGALSYIVGLNYATDDASVTQVIEIPYSATAFTFGPPPAPSLDGASTNIVQHFDSHAIFANLDYHVSDTITLHGGLRYTLADLHYDACTVPTTPGSAGAFTALVTLIRGRFGLPPQDPQQIGQCSSINPNTIGTERYFGKLSEDNLSWRAGIDFEPAAGTLLYASASKGYKAGSVSTVSATNDLQFTPVTQESVLAYEVGFKSDLGTDIAEVTAAAFYYDYKDKQVLGRKTFEPNVFGAINALTNIPESEIKGVEAQVSLYPVRGLTLTAAGTYLDSKVKGDFINEDILGAESNFNGYPFPYTPKWQLVLDGSYRVDLGGSTEGLIGANANYRSSTTAGFGTSELLDIDAYWLVDARAGVEFDNGRYGVQVFGRNIFNEYYWTNVAKSLDNVRRYAGMPATYGVQFSFKY